MLPFITSRLMFLSLQLVIHFFEQFIGNLRFSGSLPLSAVSYLSLDYYWRNHMLALIINCGTNLFSSKILFFKSWFLFSPLLHAFIINFISFSVLFLLSPHLCSNIFRNHFLSNLYSRARNKSLIPRTFCYMLSVFSSLEISTNFLFNYVHQILWTAVS